MKVFITSDSSCNLLPEQIKENDISIIPIYVMLDGEEHKDGVDIDEQTIFDYVKATKKLPKTSAISIEDYRVFFESVLAKDPDSYVLHISLSSKISSTYNNSVTAANYFCGRVVSVDGKSLSIGTGLLVLYACELAKAGLPLHEIAKRVEKRVPFVQASFIIQEVDYLYKGGRCSAVALLGANLLKIKPRIQLIDGAMQNTGKPRGKMIAVLKQYFDDTLKDYPNPDKSICCLAQTSLEPEIIDEAVEYLNSKNIFKQILVVPAGATITSHCGKGTLGMFYINDGGKNWWKKYLLLFAQF